MTEHTWPEYSETFWQGTWQKQDYSLRVYCPFHDRDHVAFITMMTCASLGFGQGAKIRLPRSYLLPELRSDGHNPFA